MQKEIEENPLVSIVVPCYNTEKFIADTIQSVLQQTVQNFELICINDGSNDNTEKIILAFNDLRIKYLSKKNTGVSDTRNIGFEMSRGTFILYLDADDMLSPDFLKKRINYLTEYPDIGFCCSEVIKIDESGIKIPEKKGVGAHADILREVLSYNLKIITCPSNYLFRKKTLSDHSIKFDTDLSSSADRFFLIELSNVAKCGLVEDSLLLYRMHSSSMSHKLTLNLLNDNSSFIKKVLTIDFIPKKLKKEFCFKTNYILAGGYYKLRRYSPFFRYSIKSFFYNPLGFIKQVSKLNHVQRMS
jgi:teichuronic acid biosynthesis glycosyltransferase TuaG